MEESTDQQHSKGGDQRSHKEPPNKVDDPAKETW
jgi:hypothetical protein